jgi:hypothetical protein
MFTRNLFEIVHTKVHHKSSFSGAYPERSLQQLIGLGYTHMLIDLTHQEKTGKRVNYLENAWHVSK